MGETALWPFRMTAICCQNEVYARQLIPAIANNELLSYPIGMA